MKIDYILSDTTKGATSATLKRITSTAESDIFGSYVVIVPETKSIIIEKELLKLSKNGSFANVYVYSFVRLLDRLGDISPEKTLSKQAAVILLRKIIYENLSKLSCYKKTAKTIGFAEKIYETIAQFKSSDVSPEELSLALSSTAKSLRAKLEDIVLIYTEYEKCIKDNLLDDFERLALLSEFAKNNEFVKDSNFYIVGFDNITFEMQRVLKDLAKNANSITFSSVYFNENRKDKHIQNNELYLKFKHIADELRQPYIPTYVKDYKSGDFYNIQNFVYSTEKQNAKSNGGICIFEARTKKQEIDFVANNIINLVKSGKRFCDIGVLVNNMEQDLPIVKKCFELYNIPYFANQGISINNHFLVKFIRSAFEVCLSHLSSEKVLKFASNIIFDSENFSVLMNFVKETGTNYSEFLKEPEQKYIEKYKSFYEKTKTLDDEENLAYFDFSAKLDSLQSDLAKLRSFFVEFIQKLDSAKYASDYIFAIEFLLEKFNVETMLLKISTSQRNLGMIVEAEVTNVILSKLKKFNMQLVRFLGKTEFSSEEFLGVYLSGISSAKISVAPVSIDTVIIQENTDGFFDIKDLFIIGANEGEFPKRINDSGIILDNELFEAKLIIGKTIEPSVKDINRREIFKVYESLLEPSEKLFISYSLKSLGGKSNKSARIILNLIRLFGDDILTKNYERQDFVNFDILERKFARQVNEFKNDEINLFDVNNTYSKLVGHESLELKNYLDSLEFSKPKFEIDLAERLYFSGEKTSISQLQTYFDCPYKFFALYGLRLKENKDSKLSFPDIGTIIHRVVELFGNNIKKYENLTDSEYTIKIKELLDISIEENEFNVLKNKSLVLELLDECIRLTKFITLEQQNSSFKISQSEYSFKNERAIKLSINDDKNLKLEGKIDRIDEFADYIRIIDYKTGSVKNDLMSVFNGQKIQLTSYFEAVSSSGKKLAGVFYFPIHREYANSEETLDKNYKMIGYLLDDIDVAHHMDNSLSEENKTSCFVPFAIKFDKKTGEISFSGRGTRYSEQEFDNLKKYVKIICEKACTEILSGYVEPSPVADRSGGDIPQSCTNCKIAGFCGLSRAKIKTGRAFSKKVDILSFDVGGNDGRD